MSHKFPEGEIVQRGWSRAAVEWFRAINTTALGAISLDTTELEALLHEFRTLKVQFDELRAQNEYFINRLPDQVVEDMSKNVIIRDPTTAEGATVNVDGRQDVVQHSHPDSGYIHCDFDVTAGAGNTDIILIDLSDTTNYPHSNTGYIHLEEIYIDVDSGSSSVYTITVGFLENVDATDGDLYEIMHIDGSKDAGLSKEIHKKFYPNGPKCTSSSIATSGITLNDTTYQTDVNLATTIDPSTADTPPGSGDLVIRAVTTSADIGIEINIAYHTHA